MVIQNFEIPNSKMHQDLKYINSIWNITTYVPTIESRAIWTLYFIFSIHADKD